MGTSPELLLVQIHFSLSVIFVASKCLKIEIRTQEGVLFLSATVVVSFSKVTFPHSFFIHCYRRRSRPVYKQDNLTYRQDGQAVNWSRDLLLPSNLPKWVCHTMYFEFFGGENGTRFEQLNKTEYAVVLNLLWAFRSHLSILITWDKRYFMEFWLFWLL